MVNKRAAKSACENLNESDGKGEDMQKRGDLSIRGENDTLLLFIIITIFYFFYTYFPKYFFIYPTLYATTYSTFLYSRQLFSTRPCSAIIQVLARTNFTIICLL